MFKAIRALIAGVSKFFVTQWGQYTPTGQLLWSLALIAMAVDAGIAYEYGSSLSGLHAAGFALVALAFAILPDIASIEHQKGKKQAAFWLAAACVPLGLVAYQSHVGYGSAIRLGDIQQTGVHNVKFADKEKSKVEASAKIETLEARRKALDEEMEALVNTKVAGWAVSVRPSSSAELDGLIEAKQLQRDNEAKRRGCKAKCEARQNEIAHLQALRGKAVQIEENEKQHSAALTGLANARNEVEQSTYQSSTAVNQTDVFAKLSNFVRVGFSDEALDVTQVQREITNTAIMGAGSLAFLILAPILNFAAGRNRRLDVEHTGTLSAAIDQLKATGKVAKDASGNYTLNLQDDTLGRQIIENLRRIHSGELSPA